MQFLRTNTAVIVTVGPFYDKTDGVTIETALTITNERITLTADTDAGSAPTNVLDNVTGATSGTSNDLNYITGNDAGMMQLELSAANVNRLGRMNLSITDAANHVPVFHEYMVLPAMIYDAFVLGTDVLDASITQLLGTAIATPTVGGVMEVDVTHNAGSVITLPTAAAVDAIDNFVDTEITDIQNRLPAALTGAGNMKSDTLAMDGSTTAATGLKNGGLGLVVGACIAGSSTTAIITNLTETTDSHYNGRVITFVTGALLGQTGAISAYNGTTKTLTVSPALTEAPANTDAFVIS